MVKALMKIPLVIHYIAWWDLQKVMFLSNTFSY